MGTTRAKFRCTGVTFRGDHNDPNTPRQYNFTAVYDTDTPENRRFAVATPWGEIAMNVNNPAARFEYGVDYYLDFTPCTEANALAVAAAEPAEVAHPDAGESTTYTRDGGYTGAHAAEVPDLKADAPEGNSVAEAYAEVRAANDAGEAHPLTAEVAGE